MARDDRGRTALGDDPHIVESRLRQQLRHRLGAALHLVATSRVGPHRLDAHQVLEVGRTDGNTSRTLATTSLMASRLTGRGLGRFGSRRSSTTRSLLRNSRSSVTSSRPPMMLPAAV